MTTRLRCQKCILQQFDGNHVIHLGRLRSFEDRNHCKLCSVVLAQLAKARPPRNSLVFLKPISESSTTYTIILNDVESNTVEGWISLSSNLPLDNKWAGLHNDNSNKLDRELIQRWLHECQSTHNHSNKIDIVGQDLVDLVFIDVQSGMLVDAEPDCEFAALSYVNGRWGGSDFNLDPFTKDDLKTPGVLFSPTFPLPAVVKDAIDLVRGIGQRYLWCDFICIFRDNHTQKQTQIRQMDEIYGRALFTIIALSAEHGNIGLPGVRENSRARVCHVADLDDETKALARGPELDLIRSRSVYTQRGWTFQEEVLSQRCIYLTDFQAYFTCSGGYKREDEHQVADFARLSHLGLFTCFEQDVPSTRPHTEQLLSLYATLLEEYSGRQLTYETDILDAFDGIRKVFSRRFSIEFIYGLPQSQLHHALLWIPIVGLDRRFETQYDSSESEVSELSSESEVSELDSFEPEDPVEFPVELSPTDCLSDEETCKSIDLPTWSWAAWRGQVGLFIPRNEPFSTDSWIHHFGVLRPGGILPLNSPENKRNSDLQLPQLMFRENPDSELGLRADNSWDSTGGKNLHYLSNISLERMELFDLKLFILDLFRAGITLIYSMVRTLLENDGEQPELPVDLEEHKIRDALGQWQSILQGSLIQLDSCPPTPTELMQSWTAIRDNLTLTYNGHPIWPFKSLFRDQSAGASCYASKRLLWFLDNHIQPRQLEERVTMAMECISEHMERFSLTPPNALCFFTYSTSVPNYLFGRQLHESSLKCPGCMMTEDGIMCDLETLQFSKYNGIIGEVERPVTALAILTDGVRQYSSVEPKHYVGVLFDYSGNLELYKDTRLLFLSCSPLYNSSGTLRYRTWNMMLVYPLKNGFYKRGAVGRFREDVMICGKFAWECKYIRLA